MPKLNLLPIRLKSAAWARDNLTAQEAHRIMRQNGSVPSPNPFYTGKKTEEECYALLNNMEIAISKLSLLHCPSCNFDDAAYEEHARRMGFGPLDKDRYMPMLYKDRFLSRWVVECRNCGIEVLFTESGEQEAADLWNNLPRKR